MSKRFHTLYEGELSDAPGRCESWTESIRHLGSGRWELVSSGTDFSGGAPGETMSERMGTRALVNWVLDRDAEDQESRSRKSTQEDDQIDTRALGERAARLLEIAKQENAKYCEQCLLGWLEHSWPPVKKSPTPRILKFNGVTTRGVFPRAYHFVYDVETSLGPGYLYPPDEDQTASLVLKSESSLNQDIGRQIRLSKAHLSECAKLTPALDNLRSSYRS